jgi:hypothetical protein
MAKSFAITTTATETLRADAKGHAEAGFTVTNTTSRPIRGLAQVRALGDTKREWLSIQGETERDFAAGATQQLTVSFNGPAADPAAAAPQGGAAPAAGAPAGPAARKYPFRLDVATALNPDEDFTEGPTVTVEIAGTSVTTKNGKFPLWIIFVIVGVLLLIGIIVLVVVLMSGDKEETDGSEPTPSPTESVSASPPQEPSPAVSPKESAAEECFKFTQAQHQNLSPIQVRGLCRGVSNPKEPSDCVTRVGPPRILSIPRPGQLTLPQAVSLCARTNNADKTVSCYQARIAKKVPTSQAINECRQVVLKP